MRRKHRGVIRYSIDDIKGLSPSLCMHRIFLNEGRRRSRQPEHCLNQNMQEVVKKEVVKLLVARIIVEYILIGYNVLMITNLNDLYT